MRLRSLLAAAALAVSSLAAHADTIDTFSFNSTLNTGTASGLLTFDETDGQFTGGSITALVNGTSYFFNQFLGSEAIDTVTLMQLATVSGTNFQVAIPGTSDIGYAGGPVCSSNTLSSCLVSGTGGSQYYYTGSYTLNDFATSGNLVPTPEPSSIALLGTGVLGMAGLLRKRYMGA